MAKKVHQVFETYLQSQGLRYTTQRKDIVDMIYSIRTHFEVEDFIDRLRKSKIKFSRATVYRTIKQLLDADLIQKIPTRDGRVFYERSPQHQHHDHMICNVCGKILEIKEDTIHTYLDQACEKMGFRAEYRSLHIYGQCAKCAS